MKFLPPLTGTRASNDMSDDNSEGISTDDARTPSEHHQNSIMIYETITYGPDDGIVLYPYDSIPPNPNYRPPQNEESEDEDEDAPKIEDAIPSSSYQHLESEEHDLLTIENLQNLRDHLNYYANKNFLNPATLNQPSPAMDFENTTINNDIPGHEQTRRSVNIYSLPTDINSRHLFLPPPAPPSTPNI